MVQRWSGLHKEFVFRACDFSLDSGFSGVQDMKGQDFHCIIIFSLHALIFDSSLYKMYVLIKFALIFQTLSDLRTSYS